MSEYDPNMFYDFCTWNEDTFVDLFRLSKQSVEVIIDRIQCEIFKYGYRQLLYMDKKVLLTLRYFATGSLMDASRMFNICQSEAKMIVKFVSCAIASLYKRFIYFPKNHYVLSKIKKNFFKITGFPMVVGAVDFPHVKIQSPEGDIAEKYRNSKDFFSVNVQIVCDANLRIQNIDACWPGSTQNSRVFKNSKIRGIFERGEIKNSVLVGDIYVPQRNYLMTPIEYPNTVMNSSLGITARDVFEYNAYLLCTISFAKSAHEAWKRRFPILAKGIDVKIASARKIIIATAVLHNIACQNRDQIPKVSDETQLLIDITDISNPRDNIGNRNEVNNRRMKILQYFKNVM